MPAIQNERNADVNVYVYIRIYEIEEVPQMNCVREAVRAAPGRIVAKIVQMPNFVFFVIQISAGGPFLSRSESELIFVGKSLVRKFPHPNDQKFLKINVFRGKIH